MCSGPHSAVNDRKQLPFPRYLLSGSRNAAMECAESEIIPLSLLAINTNKTSNVDSDSDP